MLYFAGFKQHYSLFAASGTFFKTLEDELQGYELRKGTTIFHSMNQFRCGSSVGLQNCVRKGSPLRRKSGDRVGQSQRSSRTVR